MSKYGPFIVKETQYIDYLPDSSFDSGSIHDTSEIPLKKAGVPFRSQAEPIMRERLWELDAEHLFLVDQGRL